MNWEMLEACLLWDRFSLSSSASTWMHLGISYRVFRDLVELALLCFCCENGVMPNTQRETQRPDLRSMFKCYETYTASLQLSVYLRSFLSASCVHVW